MLDRRTALQLVAVLCAASPERLRAAPAGTTQHILLSPKGADTLVLDFGSGAATVQTIRVQQGTRTATIAVRDLVAPLTA